MEDDVEASKFAQFYDEANSRIVVLNGMDIGWLTLTRKEDALELGHIYLVSTYHRKDPGTRLMQRFIA